MQLLTLFGPAVGVVVISKAEILRRNESELTLEVCPAGACTRIVNNSQGEIAGVPAKGFREGRENPQPAARLPEFRSRGRSVIELRIGAGHEPFKILTQFVRQAAVGDAIEIRGDLGVEVLQLVGLRRLEPTISS